MCGIVGITAHSAVNQELFDGLTLLQHRGQDAAGVVTTDGNRLFFRKGNGLVRDIIHTRHMQHLQGHAGIGHVRYPTAGSYGAEEAQPFYVNSPYGICLVHNGNLTNASELRDELHKTDLRHLNTNSDSEILLNVLAYELQACASPNPTAETIATVFKALYKRIRGAFTGVALIQGVGLVGFRDPNGIRPLVYGVRKSAKGEEVMFASENIALDALGFSLVDDVQPGQAIFVSETGERKIIQCTEPGQHTPCLFEYVYLARPDSIMDKISVYKTRLRMGSLLGEAIAAAEPNHDIDVVMPIPDTSRPVAFNVAQKLGVSFREGLVKNHYIGRTFIMPGQERRKKSVRQKLNAIPLEFKDKNVLLVDDSIVRGNTCEQVIKLVREAGAKRVYFASAAPPVVHPNVYGIDMPMRSDLIATKRSAAEVAALIGADKLYYQTLVDLIAAAQAGNPAINQFEDSVFSGHYITGDVDAAYLNKLAKDRGESTYT